MEKAYFRHDVKMYALLEMPLAFQSKQQFILFDILNGICSAYKGNRNKDLQMPLTSDYVWVYKRGVRGVLLLTQNRITKKQKLLIDTIVATGCSVKKASEIAGYAKGESGRVTASKTLRLPHIQEYMQQRVRESIGLNATKASNKMLMLSQGAKSEYVQLEASKDILDRAGYKPIEKSMNLVTGNIQVSIDLT